MVGQLPLEQSFIVSVWVEVRANVYPASILSSYTVRWQALLYGFLLALFLVSLYINITLRRFQDVHSKVRLRSRYQSLRSYNQLYADHVHDMYPVVHHRNNSRRCASISMSHRELRTETIQA